MLLQYFVPGPMSRGPLGPQELKRREAVFRRWVEPTTRVSVRDAPNGPHSIESVEQSAGADAIVLRGARDAERAGYHAVIVGCFGDPGVAAARHRVAIPVIGPGEASIGQACRIGRFSIITLLDETIPLHDRQVRAAGRNDRLASIKPTGIRVLDLPKNPSNTMQRIVEVGREAVREDGADVLILGCMSMSFMAVDEQVAREIGVPVINAARAALVAAHALAASVQPDTAVNSAIETNDRTGTQHMSAAQ